jgi:hypothetical protein
MAAGWPLLKQRRWIETRVRSDFVRGWAGVVQAACEHAVAERTELHTGDEFQGSVRGYVRGWQVKWWVFKPTAKENMKTASRTLNPRYLASCRASAVHGGVLAPRREPLFL